MPTKNQLADYKAKGIETIGNLSIRDSIRKASAIAGGCVNDGDRTEFDNATNSMLSICNMAGVHEEGERKGEPLMAGGVRIKAYRVLLELQGLNLKSAEVIGKLAETESRIENPEQENNQPIINITLGQGTTLDDVAKSIETQSPEQGISRDV